MTPGAAAMRRCGDDGKLSGANTTTGRVPLTEEKLGR